MKNYELIEHTADVGIRVRGKGLNELFQNAAVAMFEIIAEEKGVAGQLVLARPANFGLITVAA